jgi:cytoskeletal protein RodZ
MTDESTALSVGDFIATARRQAGLTITQVSQRTCIRETIVRGIERGDYSACGGDFYARGHVRSIARAVGLDPDELVREYDISQAPPPPITAADVFQPFTPVKLRERRRPNWAIVLLAGLVVVAGIVGFRYFSHSSSPPARHSTSNHHSSNGAKPAAASSPAVPTQVQVYVLSKPGQVTWAQFTASTGQMLFEGDIGTSVGLPQVTETASAGMTVQLGNPQAASVYLNGKLQPINSTIPITLHCTPTSCS